MQSDHPVSSARRPDPDAMPADFCADLIETVDALITVLNEETRLVRAAKLSEAATLSGEKSLASERYIKAHGVLRGADSPFSALASDEVGHLRERHQALETAISQNLAVLATARTVSETLIHSVSDIVARKRGRTNVYGANGQQAVQQSQPGPVSCNVAL